MATTFSRINLINSALLAQGQTEISDGDNSLEWRTLSTNWPMIVEAELQDGAYNFTLIEDELPTRAGDGIFGYTDAYTTPADALHVRNVWTEDSMGTRTDIDWYQGKTNINVDAATGIFVEYVEASDPDQFSALFATGIQMKLEALILRSMKEEYGNARDLEAMAEEKLQRARTNSSNSKAPRPLFRSGGRFVDARFRRG